MNTELTLSQNISHIRELINLAEQQSEREPGSVLLLAVSKQQNAARVAAAFQSGINNFGENYYQEALQKQSLLSHLPICWHFIGPIQSNKAKGIATHFDWVHSVNRLKIAELLSYYRPASLTPLNVCIHVNLVEEQSKAGVSPEEVMELATAINQLPHINLRGLMTIPPPQKDPQQDYDLLMQLNHLMHQINRESGLAMDTLSMGMSNDLAPAIQAGSTIVRIGRAIFGERQGKLI